MIARRTLKVASYNIHKGVGLDRRRNPERVVEVLGEIDADVIALQEADRRFGRKESVLPAHLLAEHSDWKPVEFGPSTLSMGWHGNVILIRKQTTLVDSAALHLPSLEPRGALMADVDGPLGTIRVVGMHLDLSGLWRRRQAAAIMGHVDACPRRYPTVLMGDLNEWTKAGGCLRDFARAYASAATGPSFHARRPVGRLDRIMVSRELRIADCGVHASAAARKASDHLPIWAVLEAA